MIDDNDNDDSESEYNPSPSDSNSSDNSNEDNEDNEINYKKRKIDHVINDNILPFSLEDAPFSNCNFIFNISNKEGYDLTLENSYNEGTSNDKFIDDIDDIDDNIDTHNCVNMIKNGNNHYLEYLRNQVNEINNKDNNILSLSDRILLSNFDLDTKAKLILELETGVNMERSDRNKLNNWVNQILKIPVGIYRNNFEGKNINYNNFLVNARTKLNDIIYRMEETKEEILDFLVNYISNPNKNGTIIGLKGPKGVGKTKLCRALADILDLPLFQLSMGGLTDSSVLIGHDRTYVGAKCGKIATFVQQAKCMNFIIYIDELDKCGTDRESKGIYGVLTHLLDETQNKEFQDLYFDGINLDLSKVLFIASYNNEEDIDPIVLNRMKVINIKELNIDDKIVIVRDYILPEINYNNIIINDDVIRYIILNKTNSEDGMRNIKKNIETIINRTNTLLFLENCENKSRIIENFSYENIFLQKNENNSVVLTTKIVDVFLSKHKDNEQWKTMYI